MTPIKGTIGKIICEHRVTCEYYYDVLTDIWHAKIRHYEARQGRQYGGEVVTEITSAPGARHDDFMREAMKEAKKGMALFWCNEGLRKGKKDAQPA